MKKTTYKLKLYNPLQGEWFDSWLHVEASLHETSTSASCPTTIFPGASIKYIINIIFNVHKMIHDTVL